MNNPNISRHGAVQYWLNMWFTDFNFSSTLHADNLFDKLLTFYINFGFNEYYDRHYHNYWYRKTFYGHKKFYNDMYNSYFRPFEAPMPDNMGFIRGKFRVFPLVYPLRTWVYRFNNWVIIQFVWFSPAKIGHKSASYKPPKKIVLTHSLPVTTIRTKTQSNGLYRNSKIINSIIKTFTKLTTVNLNYSF